jgi:toxin HigB-1
VEIEFATSRLARLCNSEREARRRLGEAGARKLRARLADLEAAYSVAELVAGRPHPLRGDREGQFALYLDGGRRLVFSPAENPTPTTEKGDAVDWNRVTAVRIEEIGDYHE